jgi:hypothetical protein
MCVCVYVCVCVGGGVCVGCVCVCRGEEGVCRGVGEGRGVLCDV